MQSQCMVFGTRAKNNRCIHALLVNKTFNTYRVGLQRLENKVFFHSLIVKNNRITEYTAQIKSKSGFASEFDPQLTQKSTKVKLRWA